MLKIKKLIKPKTLEEAYEILVAQKWSKLIAGGVFLRLSHLHLATAIDLEGLDLNYINNKENEIEIGAMTTLRDLETNKVLKEHFTGILPESVSHIVGVQLRNISTVGATVASRYGFSDLISALLVLDTKLVFFNAGEISLNDYLKQDKKFRDILIKIVIKKDNKKAAFQYMRDSESDFAILNAAVSKDETGYKIAIGARPGRAKLIEVSNIKDLDISQISFGTNIHGTKAYREMIAPVLVERAVKEVEEFGN